MDDQLVTFETAMLAKEVGFKERCIKTYNASGKINKFSPIDYICEAPTQSLLQKWIREMYSIIIEVHYTGGIKSHFYDWIIYYLPMPNDMFNDEPLEQKYKSYEDALEDGLDEALHDIIKFKIKKL